MTTHFMERFRFFPNSNDVPRQLAARYIIDAFLAEVRRKSDVLQKSLKNMAAKYPRVEKVEGDGMMWGLPIQNEKGEEDSTAANQIVLCALDGFNLRLRISMYGFGNVVKVRPALIATDDELQEIVQRLDGAFNKTLV